MLDLPLYFFATSWAMPSPLRSLLYSTIIHYDNSDFTMLNCMFPSGFSTATGYPARPPESGKGAAGLSQN